MSSALFSHIWGPMNPDIIFYLPTPPALPEHWQATHVDAVTQLVALNGNHWRKIVTIMAKICCLEHDINANKGACWKLIRDNLFSESAERHQPKTDKNINSDIKTSRLRCQLRIVKADVHYSDDLKLPSVCWHIICGKEAQLRMGITDPRQYSSLDDQQKIQRQPPVLMTPYLDYRQYSNALIELTRQHIAATKH
ncbi:MULTISPECIES: DUF6942 family protein [Shewanella]|nr:hypothetical protein [Shewanella psychromarinicola]